MIEVAVVKSSPSPTGKGGGGKGGPPRSADEGLLRTVSGASENIRRTVASLGGGELSDGLWEKSFFSTVASWRVMIHS